MVLLNLIKDSEYKKKAMLVIAKLIDYTLISSIKTVLISNIYYFAWLAMTEKTREKKRKSVYVTKKIVKCIMNEGGSCKKPVYKSKTSSCLQRKCIYSKLHKLQRVRLDGTSHYFYYAL